MAEENDIEARVRDLEAFRDQVLGGRKVLLWVASAFGAGLGLLGVFWERLFK